MSVDINRIINITSNVINPVFDLPFLIANVLTENVLVPASPNPILGFNSLKEVGDYFGTDSNEYMFSNVYFKGFDGYSYLPARILFSRYVTPTGSIAYMITNTIKNPSKTIDSIKNLATPSLSFKINGVIQSLSLVQADFAAATGLTSIASILNTKLSAVLPNATVEIIANNRFKITSPNVVVSTIDYSPTSNLADLIHTSSAFSPILSQGDVGGDAAYNMDRIVSYNKAWESLTYVTQLTGDNILSGYPITVQLTKWIDDNKELLLVFMPFSQTEEDISISSTTSLRAILIENGYGNISPSGKVVYTVLGLYTVYGMKVNSSTTNEVGIYSAFNSGIGASQNYNIANGKVNFSGRSQSGLVSVVDNTDDYDKLILQSYEVYAKFSSSTQIYNFSEDGSIGGDYFWIDNQYDSRYLAETITNSLANFIKTNHRIPYNIQGQALVRSVLDGVAAKCINNGIIESGNIFDESQKIAIIQMVGIDITNILFQSGYYIGFSPITPQDRSSRAPMKVFFVYCNGGAVNRFDLNNIFVS